MRMEAAGPSAHAAAGAPETLNTVSAASIRLCTSGSIRAPSCVLNSTLAHATPRCQRVLSLTALLVCMLQVRPSAPVCTYPDLR